jgi:hypothetical protein
MVMDLFCSFRTALLPVWVWRLVIDDPDRRFFLAGSVATRDAAPRQAVLPLTGTWYSQYVRGTSSLQTVSMYVTCHS